MTGAVFTDLCRDKIYNAWVIPGFLAGMTTALFRGGGQILVSLSAAATALAILIPIYLIKGIAAGDVKLLVSAATFLSVQDTLSCILISFLIAGFISVAVLILKRNKQKTIHFAVPVLISALFLHGGVI